jgi:hypothetical protein
MISVTALLGALGGPEEVRLGRHRYRVTKTGAVIALWLVALITLVLALVALWSAWAANQSLRNVGFTGMALTLAGVAWCAEATAVMIIALPTKVRSQQQSVANTLRALIARQDDTLTPRVLLQPRRKELGEGVTELRPFQEVPSGRNTIWVVVLVAVFLCAMIVGITPLGTLLTGNANAGISMIQVTGIVGNVVLMAVVGWQAYRARHSARVTIDDQGLCIRWGRRNQLIAWGDIKSVTQIVAAPLLNRFAVSLADVGLESSSTAYFIDDGAHVFAWYVASALNDKEYRAGEALLGHVVARTGLPLRDATGLASDLRALSLPRARALLTERTPTSAADTLLAALRAAVAQLAPARRPSRLKFAALAVLLVALAIPNLALPAAAQRLEQTRNRYDATYYTTVRASRPMYSTSFAYNDGNWPQTQASSGENRSYLVADGAYHVAGTLADGTAIVYYPAYVGDAAVEVTVAQQEQSPPLPRKGADSGAGVLFHSDANFTRFLEFEVDVDGHWALWRHSPVADSSGDHWLELDAGYSATINTGYGARNTIFYVQRGRRITVRVNGQPIMDEDYSASYFPDLPLEGYAGLYSGQSGLDIAFTEFTLYRLPSPTSFWSALGVRWALPGSHSRGG